MISLVHEVVMETKIYGTIYMYMYMYMYKVVMETKPIFILLKQ